VPWAEAAFHSPHLFNGLVNESDSRDWKGDLKTPLGVGLFKVGPDPRPLFFLFFGGADVTHKQIHHRTPRRRKTKKIERDGAEPINRPILPVFLTLTPSGTYTALQEMWVMTRADAARLSSFGRYGSRQTNFVIRPRDFMSPPLEMTQDPTL
jgi:hypothetical protein